MSRTKTTARPIQQVLDRLENVRRSGGEWSALCPAHDDNNPSLSIKEGDDGRVLLKCHAGCGVEDIVTELDLDMEDLFSQPRTKKQGGAGTTLGLTLEAYAEAKRLPVDFLQELGVGQIYLQGMPVVRMPYLDHNGVVLSTRMRVSFEDGFRWKTGSKPTLYGLWRLRESKSKYVCVVEGESDCQTLWLHGFPVLGLPGADTWKEEWVEYFDAFQCIFVVIEPDRGGDAVPTWLQKSRIRDRVRLIKLDGAKVSWLSVKWRSDVLR